MLHALYTLVHDGCKKKICQRYPHASPYGGKGENWTVTVRLQQIFQQDYRYEPSAEVTYIGIERDRF